MSIVPRLNDYNARTHFPSTVLIVCCNSEESQARETLSTLKFGEYAKRVTNFVSPNVVAAPDEVAAQLSELRGEVIRLKRQVSSGVP